MALSVRPEILDTLTEGIATLTSFRRLAPAPRRREALRDLVKALKAGHPEALTASATSSLPRSGAAVLLPRSAWSRSRATA
ncbi:MAG: hypothetical protein ACR2MY_01445 [Candidatus Dormibacteria bacterium]